MSRLSKLIEQLQEIEKQAEKFRRVAEDIGNIISFSLIEEDFVTEDVNQISDMVRCVVAKQATRALSEKAYRLMSKITSGDNSSIDYDLLAE